MQYLRQSTASQEVLLGPFVDDTDGKTAETWLTIANTDIKLWVEGGTSEASKNSGGATHIASGRYYAVLDATDTATCGKLTINVAVAGALPVQARFMVVPAMIYDSLFLGTDRFDTNVTHIGDTSQTARDIGASVLLSSGTGTGQLDFTSGVVKANVTQIGGDTQSTTDLKDFADTGYDPATHKVQGVVLADTTTTVTNAVTVGTNNDKTGYTVSTVSDKTGYSLIGDYDAAKTAAQPGDEMDLVDAPNVAARDAIATTVEAHLLDEGDSQMLINAIVGAIGNTNIDQAVLVAAIRADLERTDGNLNTLIGRLTSQRATNLDNLDAAISSRLAPTTSGRTLDVDTSNRAPANVTSWRGSQPGNLDSNGFVPSNLASINGNTTRATTLATALDNDRLDAKISTRMAASDYVAPDNAGIAAAESAANTAAAVSAKLNTALEDDGATGYQFTTLALANAPTGGGGGDATLENQTEMLSRLAAIKTVTDKEATLLEDAGGGNSRFKSAALTNAPVGDIAGDGSVLVDHDYGDTDALAYKTSEGAGIDNAVVQAFVAADYTAGLRSSEYVVGETKTNSTGRWVRALALDPGNYVLIYYKQGQFGPDRHDLTVE